MKALTVKQPWADLIVTGAKDIENRTWQTKFRGRILIHAAKSIVPVEDLLAYPLPALRREIPNFSEIRNYMTGTIIGSVEIVDCVKNHPSEWAEEDVWNWVLANPIQYETPIFNVPGKLSLWEYNHRENVDADKLSLYTEYMTSLAKADHRPKDNWFWHMNNKMASLPKNQFLETMAEIIAQTPYVSEWLDIQYFQNKQGQRIAEIWATPDKSYILEASELIEFENRIKIAMSRK